ncbi:MAG TPA: polysaccharide deacetylase family protein [candidate division Zixibacteria bacterium]|nr:polysaccharide deacetylase family protein [candidate division Zixibacteria bacterium]MDD4918669.1 polysaccharide deacetylase family protein [candidate division Zixibacteria bacterium]MDM7971717.1 polysaccharide deacetylase family protein [candidate division Zixibacteria bacterium]HPC12088.1 polysaccharide deacetylase family protein [candidate division Zixibacteria bacterium]HPI33144.1 polysaccharide deacetylase family protein [candidate division Zixibacteria bacterium]
MHVLAFHKLTRRLTFGSTNYRPDRFRRLLVSLLTDGYTFVPLDGAGERRTTGERELAITFDDGYGHLVDALPGLMEEFGFRPTVFVPTGYLGRPNAWDYSFVFRAEPHLTAGDIRALSACGVAFGSHGHTHTDLTRLSDSTLIEQLRVSRAILEDLTGYPVTALSYPFGRVDSRVSEYARAAGYCCGYTLRFPSLADTLFTAGRYGVWCFDTPGSVRRKLRPGPLQSFERLKARVTHALSAGTRLTHRRVRGTARS